MEKKNLANTSQSSSTSSNLKIISWMCVHTKDNGVTVLPIFEGENVETALFDYQSNRSKKIASRHLNSRVNGQLNTTCPKCGSKLNYRHSAKGTYTWCNCCKTANFIKD